MNEIKTVLVVDDTETNIDILVELLDDYYVLVALDGETALEIALEEKVDVILLDIMMPVMDGFEVCKRLKEQKTTKDIPVIFITAKSDEDSIENAYDIGGVDYVTKPFKPRELLARLNTHLRLNQLINDLEFLASHDQMTGIYNRRKFFELSIQKFKHSKKEMCAVMIDIDKFKNINDTYGHSVGDSVIKQVTKHISDNLNDEAIFGRVGGEEFAIILSNSSTESVSKEMEKIRKIIEKLEVIASDGNIVKFTISLGISESNENTDSIDSLLKQADTALYEAKGSGRNRGVIFR